MRIYPFQAKYPNFDYITSSDSFFSNVKQEYPDYDKSGFFKRSPHEGFYLYEIRTNNRSFTGLVACVDIREYFDGHIKKHENTLAAKEQRQMQLLMHRHAMVKPVLLFHPPLFSLSQILEKYKKHEPLYTAHFEELDEWHFMWEISEGEVIRKVQEQFREFIPEAYIADGHHRSSMTALLYERRKGKKDVHKFEKLLCTFFPASELEIFDYNRVVEALEEVSVPYLFARLSKVVDIDVLSVPAKPHAKHEMSMVVNKEWFSLRWKPEVVQAWPEEVVLDASLLDHHVFNQILGIEDVRTDQRLKYVEGTRGLDEFRAIVAKGEHRIGFCLYPVDIEDLIHVADAGKIMPPKSTWFEPRMKNGLVVYEI